MKAIIVVPLFFTFLSTALAHTADEWRSRNIYQLLTDRFAKSPTDVSPCLNLHDYCGGTFRGIINNLDYITDMGFDAIWISPIVLNTPGGYHGYWAQNIFEINPEFGSAKDFKALIEECHKRDVWVMVDVVANHMGNMQTDGDYTDKIPFNHPSYYHDNNDCSLIDQNNQDLLQTCWLAQLPDLNQDNEFVRETLLKWISNLIATYNIDGIRIDTVPYVSKDFWKNFKDAAGVYSVGEVFNSNLTYDAGYEGPMDGVLNYPLFFALRSVFQSNNSMNTLQAYYKDASSAWVDTGLLGNFVDNHDNARFLNSGNKIAFKSALAFALFAEGIPMTYYGSEQDFSGGNDPDNREVLWTHMNENSETYQFLKKINSFRKQHQIYKHPQIERYSDDNFYAFTRGDVFLAFTNSLNRTQRIIENHPYPDNTILCNALSLSDCLIVQNGKFEVTLNHGELKIYSPVLEITSQEKPLYRESLDVQNVQGQKFENKIKGGLYENLKDKKKRRLHNEDKISN